MTPDVTSIKILTYCGIWRPEKWTAGWKFWFYNSYTVVVIFLVFSMPVFQFTEFWTAINYNNIHTDCTYMMTMIFACVKIAVMVRYRERIIKLLAMLYTKDRQVENSNHQIVQHHFHRLIRRRNKAYSLLLFATIIAMTVSFYSSELPNRTLPYSMWLPFNTTTNFAYGLKFADEYAAMTISAFIGIGFDTFLFAMMIQICALFGLLKCRIKSLDATLMVCSEETGLECSKVDLETDVKNCIAIIVRHHVRIHQLSAELNCIFSPVILCNYLTSTATLSMTVYAMSQVARSDQNLVLAIVYATLTLIEMYMLCYIGSELTDASASISHAIYDIKWYNLSKSNKKSILITASHASRPVIFTCGKIFQISIESFVKLLQFTYSAYTCLKKISK